MSDAAEQQFLKMIADTDTGLVLIRTMLAPGVKSAARFECDPLKEMHRAVMVRRGMRRLSWSVPFSADRCAESLKHAKGPILVPVAALHGQADDCGHTGFLNSEPNAEVLSVLLPFTTTTLQSLIDLSSNQSPGSYPVFEHPLLTEFLYVLACRLALGDARKSLLDGFHAGLFEVSVENFTEIQALQDAGPAVDETLKAAKALVGHDALPHWTQAMKFLSRTGLVAIVAMARDGVDSPGVVGDWRCSAAEQRLTFRRLATKVQSAVREDEEFPQALAYAFSRGAKVLQYATGLRYRPMCLRQCAGCPPTVPPLSTSRAAAFECEFPDAGGDDVLCAPCAAIDARRSEGTARSALEMLRNTSAKVGGDLRAAREATHAAERKQVEAQTEAEGAREAAKKAQAEATAAQARADAAEKAAKDGARERKRAAKAERKAAEHAAHDATAAARARAEAAEAELTTLRARVDVLECALANEAAARREQARAAESRAREEAASQACIRAGLAEAEAAREDALENVRLRAAPRGDGGRAGTGCLARELEAVEQAWKRKAREAEEAARLADAFKQKLAQQAGVAEGLREAYKRALGELSQSSVC